MTHRAKASRFLCPVCQSSDTHIVNSCNEPSGGRRRRYKCKECGAAFGSLEMLLTDDTSAKSTADRFKHQFLKELTFTELFTEIGNRLENQGSTLTGDTHER